MSFYEQNYKERKEKLLLVMFIQEKVEKYLDRFI